MSETKQAGHTQGPWRICDETYFHASRKGGTTVESMPLTPIIASDDPFPTEIALAWKSKANEDRDLANARLIAAAPDLYAACDRLLDASARGCPSPEKFLSEAIALARAAIAKATGETP